jgi:excisionase family DNA binding protein
MSPIAVGVADAAKLIGISKSRLYELIAEGEIDARKIGFRTVIPYERLQDYVLNSPKLGQSS